MLVACGGSGGGGLVASTSLVVSETGGAGASSHLDVLFGQALTFEIAFDDAVEGFGVVGGCPTNERTQLAANASASGASAASVEAEIFGYLPDWRLRLSLCEVEAQSSVQLSADNQMNTGFTLGCIGLPASAIRRDAEGNPVWSSFTAPACTLTILDADTNRLIGARDFALRITAD